MKGVDGYGFNDACDGITEIAINNGVPLHAGAGRQERGKSRDRLEAFDAIGGCPLYPCDSSESSPSIAIAGRLPAPRRAIDIGRSIDDTQDGVIVIE